MSYNLGGIAYPNIHPSEIRPDGILACDFENDEETLAPLLLSFAWRENGELKSVVYDCQRTDSRLKEAIFDLFRRSRAVLAHNILHEMKILHYWGFDTRTIEDKIEDTMVIAHCVDTEADKDLKSMCRNLLGMNMGDYKTASKSGRTAFIEYNREDSVGCLLLFEKIHDWTRRWDVNTVYKMELAVIPWLLDAYVHGVHIDLSVLDELNKELDQSLMTYESTLIDTAGGMINLNSTKQLGKLFYEDWKLPVNPTFVTKTGAPGTSTEAIEWMVEFCDLKEEQSEFMLTLLDYKKEKKLQDSFVGPNFTKRIHADGKLRTNIKSVLTKTGRESSSDPNLQNIPSKGEGKIVRKAFIPTPGNDLICSDYSQIEYRLFAHFSRGEALIDAYHQGKDFHQAVADLLRVPRPLAKTINFAMFYGAGLPKFMRLVNRDLRKSKLPILGKTKAEEYHKMYLENPDRQKLLDGCLRYAKANSFMRTLSGRIRRFDGYTTMNEGTLGRYALSTLIQGSAADLMKLAKIRLRKVLPREVKMVLAVHDELLFDCPKELTEKVLPVIQEEMENVHKFAVPLVAEPGVATSWYDAK